MYRKLLLIITIFSSLFSNELEKISLQLNWKYQFEFAGFITAKEKGYYKEVGLDVDIKEFNFGIDVLQDIKNGKSNYGIYDLSLLHLKDDEKPVKLIANYFKRSALVLITNQDIVTPVDLKDKIIMADAQQIKSSTINTLLKKFNIKDSDYIFKQHKFTPDDFIQGKVDVMSAYLSNELYHIRKSKKSFNIIDPLSYGIYGSGVNVFTTKEETLRNPDRVKNFIEATNRGWKYALENKEEIVDIIYEKYTKLKSKEALLFEAKQTEKLIMPEIYNIGEINKTLIQRNINDFASEGLLKNKFDVDSIIFNYKTTQSKIDFTPKQIEYKLKKKEITMCIDPDWMPYEKIQEGKHIGMTSEYIPMFSEKIGIPIKLIPTKSWSESIEFAKKRECDIFSLAMATPNRLEYMNFTLPYINFPIVIATKLDKFFVSNPEDLITKKRVGIVKGY